MEPHPKRNKPKQQTEIPMITTATSILDKFRTKAVRAEQDAIAQARQAAKSVADMKSAESRLASLTHAADVTADAVVQADALLVEAKAQLATFQAAALNAWSPNYQSITALNSQLYVSIGKLKEMIADYPRVKAHLAAEAEKAAAAVTAFVNANQ